MLSSKKRDRTFAKSYSKSKSKPIVNAMKQPLQHQLQMPLMGVPSMPALNYQPHFVGSQTISRSSNLHKQFYSQAQAAANRCSIYQQPVPPTGYLYYDQPTSDYQAPHQQLYGPPGQPHTMHRYSYGPMSLALRAPRDRSSIPMPMIQQAVYQQPMQLNGAGNQTEFEEQKKSPLSAKLIYQEPTVNLIRTLEQQARLNKPLCRCRVMYLGSSVPHITKNGLHGIQEPLRHLYPEEQFNSANLRHSQKMVAASVDSGPSNPATSQTIDISHLSSSLGIDSWLSVWSNGLLLENVDEFGRDVRRFYSIESLHYCAAVRFFDTTTLMEATNQPSTNKLSAQSHEPDANNNEQPNWHKQQEASPAQIGAGRRGVVRFLPLDAPIFQYPGMMDANHPPVFAAIMRRTTGIKVLECHAFICRRDAASNALVRCCTHAYSDFLSAKRLSADFGFLQQQQASAYLGQTTVNAANSMAVNDELHARGQTMPSSQSRQIRSASVGRHSKSSRQPLDGGQYQVIETLTNQSQQNTSKGNHKCGSRKRRAARNPQASSTGTNSNELTHSESLNSADESEPEDNYAIIPKSSANNSAVTSGKLAASRQQAGRDRSSRRRSRTIKGSSKSLFKDFMPPPLELSRQSAHELDIEKLSHSLDYLAMMSSQQPVANTSERAKRGDKTTHKSDYDEPSHEFGAQSDIMYSIVSTKSKRHSKSMQNLVQQQHHQPNATSMKETHSSQTTARLISGDRRGPLGGAHRKSASLQDILVQEDQFEGVPVAQSRSSFASLSRRSSLRSSLASQRRRSRQSTSNSHINLFGSQNHDEAGQRKSSFVSSTEGNNTRIYAICDNSHQKQENMRILGPDCCTSSMRSRSHSRAGSSKRSRSKRRDHELPSTEQPFQTEAHQELNGYSQPAPVHLQSLYNPLLSGPAPQQAVYMAPSAFYGQPNGAPLYSSNSIYDTVTPPPAPFMPLPYVHSQYHHPHQQLFFPAPPPPAQLSQQHHLQPPAHYSMLAVEAKATNTKGRSKSKSATLATRFRCLSPPLNFFSSSANQTEPQQQQLSDNSSSHATQTGLTGPRKSLTRGQQGEQANGHHESLASLANCLDERGQVVSQRAAEIVSGQPGFLSNQSGELTAIPKASPTGRKQKLSWIKRLSISLSAGGSASQATGRALSAAAQSRTSGFEQTPVQLALGAEPLEAGSEAAPLSTGLGLRLDSVAENSRLNELNCEAGVSPDGQSLPDQQSQRQPEESAGHQMDGFQNRGEQSGEQEPVGEEKKTKRKRAGFFSGALTLGRSSGQKRAQAAKIVT